MILRTSFALKTFTLVLGAVMLLSGNIMAEDNTASQTPFCQLMSRLLLSPANTEMLMAIIASLIFYSRLRTVKSSVGVLGIKTALRKII